MEEKVKNIFNKRVDVSTVLYQVKVVLLEANNLSNSLCTSVKRDAINRGVHDKYFCKCGGNQGINS